MPGAAEGPHPGAGTWNRFDRRPAGEEKRFSAWKKSAACTVLEEILETEEKFGEDHVGEESFIWLGSAPDAGDAPDGNLESGLPVRSGGEVPLWLSIPFAGLLLCIALCPLLCSSWWESHQPLAVAFWSLAFLIPYALMGGLGTAVETALECLIGDYLTFIVLLFGLFCVAGNISLEGDLAGSPRINVFLLLLGTVLSSWIGTTGASMLMVRPVIKMNAWRRHRSHIMVFFIFLISNMGGCLTPIGDPPLLMGFSRGVPFFWSLQLAPVLLFNAVILLAVFYWIDMRAYRKDIAAGNMPDIRKPGTEIHIRGLHNLIFLVMIVAAVVLSGVLPTLPMFQNEAGEVIGIPIFGEVTLTIPALLEIIIILLAAFLSFKTTDVSVRKSNHFTWGPSRRWRCSLWASLSPCSPP